ncbi:hypothetical protein BT69DRAFT_911042 [Atractiella rhizophila]|nr:hypothetical protein BT69DRAFT_911042 [Atractiella rhizophila]
MAECKAVWYRNAPDPGTSGGSLIDFTTPIQAQPTGYPLQFASYNPYAQFQQQQDDYMRMQAAAEQQRQMEEAAAQAAYQQQMLQAQAAQAEAQRQAEAQAYQQQMLFQQQQAQQQQAYLQAQATAAPLMPQHTAYGSNNPFAPFSQAASPPPPMPSIPDQSPSLFSSIPASSPAPAPAPAPVPAHSPSPAFNQPKKKDDGEFAKLAALLGNREDGVDSFGNVGNLRVRLLILFLSF